MEMARSLLKGRNIPGEFWGEAVRHAVYLLNRLPSKSLPDITPYEAWYGKKPNLEHLKIFGCVVFAKYTGGHLKKLDDRSKKMVYFGVEDGTKGNRLYDPQDRKLRVSRDVVFDEKESWDWCKSMEEQRPAAATFTIIKPVSQTPSETPQNSPQTTHNQPVHPEFENVFSGQPYPEDVEADSDPNIAALDPSSSPSTDPSNSPNALGPRGFRSLSDIYARSHEVTLEPEELMMAETDQPSTFEEAVVHKAWREAMQAELDAIEKNKTWQLTSLPPGHKAIGLKWVYKVKKDNMGNMVKYKARLVAKGYVQKQGVDYDEVFAPVARLDTIRVILALAAQHGWSVHHLDVKSAFLNGDLEEEVYVTQPEGYVNKNQSQKVFKLFKALYGLRQAPRAWNVRLDKSMKGLGFLKSSQDPAVYTRNSKGKTLIVGVYVDDLIITGSHTQDIVEFKEQMKNEFEMSDLGLLAYYLGIEVSQKKWGIALRQTCYARKLLEQFGMQYCNPTKSPMEPKLKVDNDEGGEEIDSTEYRRLVGCLRYLTHTRPDLSYSVGIASRFMEKPTTLHFQVVKRILRYIKGTLDYGINYEKGSEFKDLVGFTDSDHGGDPVGGKSTGGMIFYLGRNAITWQSQKQKTVALSSCEAEFMAATSAACQAIWLANLVKELTGQQVEPTTLFVDNKSAIALMKNPVSHGRSKHINIHFHFIRECVKQRKIIVEHVNSKDQRADLFTKALALVKFIEMRNKLGLTDTEPGPI
ncbi:putative RNA-directed DNA polymerase [Tanacetum coccineum]